MADQDVFIEVTKDGPYLVHGELNVVQETIVPDEEGASWDYQKGEIKHCEKDPTALCRCGHSHNAPCCDGSHQQVSWDGEETASFVEIEQGAQQIPGPNLTLLDNERYCAYARFCDAKGRIWNLVQVGEEETDELAIREAFHCPAGRLMMYENAGGKRLEPKLEKEIGALEDPVMDCSGPLYVKGGVRVQSENGKSYQIRNRQTLCRCGQSSNKPFCDGSHATVKFKAGFNGD